MGRRKKTHEEFVAEVKALVGDEYIVKGEYKNSTTKIELIHQTCGKRYVPTPNSFLSGARCSRCEGNKKRTTEEFKQEVFNLVGEEYVVVGKYKTSKRKIELLHNHCGNIYLAVPSGFLNGVRCSWCHGNKKKTTEEFKQEVYKLEGEDYQVIGEYKNRKTKIEMFHRRCGKAYSVAPGGFLEGHRCLYCGESKGERKIREWLEYQSIPYLSQIPIKYSQRKRALLLDFLVHGVAIEYDGEQHFKPIDFFGGETKFKENQRRDRIKDKYCADNGIPLIRIPYWDFDNIDAILTEKLLPLIETNVNLTQNRVS